MPAAPFIVIDFETTGMGPAQGARATEIAAVRVEDGRVTGHYQSLMNAGVWVPPFITALTGITNQMLAGAPPAAQVMQEVAAFCRSQPLVAHNAAFDRGFWAAEMAQAGVPADPAHAAFACTVLLSRRLYPEAPSHRLSHLADWLGLRRDGRAHRALSDAELTAQLLIRLQRDVTERFAEPLGGAEACHAALCVLQRAPKPQLARALSRWALARPGSSPAPA
jgi:DNA polymerase III subunit epsilon